MSTRRVALVLIIAGLLAACAGVPQAPVPLAKEALSTQGSRIGVAMTVLPKVDSHLPGADCLLCMAFASAANSALTAHFRTLPHEDLPKLKSEIADLLKKKGNEVVLIDADIALDSLPKARAQQPNFAAHDFSALGQKHNVDRLLVVDIHTLGVLRTYSAYISTADPKAVLRGRGYIVNLKSGALEWYAPVEVLKSADTKWDEPPKFPGLTNAYFQALELGRDGFLKPFQD